MSAVPNERAWQRTLTCIRFADSRPRPRFPLRPVPCRLAGAKAELDPAGIMNPGVLIRPAGPVNYSHEGDR
jgi:hypothetical protein